MGFLARLSLRARPALSRAPALMPKGLAMRQPVPVFRAGEPAEEEEQAQPLRRAAARTIRRAEEPPAEEEETQRISAPAARRGGRARAAGDGAARRPVRFAAPRNRRRKSRRSRCGGLQRRHRNPRKRSPRRRRVSFAAPRKFRWRMARSRCASLSRRICRPALRHCRRTWRTRRSRPRCRRCGAILHRPLRRRAVPPGYRQRPIRALKDSARSQPNHCRRNSAVKRYTFQVFQPASRRGFAEAFGGSGAGAPAPQRPQVIIDQVDVLIHEPAAPAVAARPAFDAGRAMRARYLRRL